MKCGGKVVLLQLSVVPKTMLRAFLQFVKAPLTTISTCSMGWPKLNLDRVSQGAIVWLGASGRPPCLYFGPAVRALQIPT